MTFVLIRKLLRDIWVSLLVVALLLCAFQCLWAHVTRRISTELIPQVTEYILKKRPALPLQFVPEAIIKQQAEQVARDLQELLFQGPGKIVQSLIGGESITLTNTMNLMSVGYVHPLIQTILCIWAIGRAAGAIAGELDRGTMELLLAEPVPRSRIILAHFCVDVLTIPILCLSLWGGTWLGTWMVGLMNHPDPALRVDPLVFGPALLNIGFLLFAVSGSTLVLSALGRFRSRVLGLAVLIALVQFLINLIGQLWDEVNVLRPFTLFYYYQPQNIILHSDWASNPQIWLNFTVLGSVGAIGYLLALWIFTRRDLPAPL